VLRINVTWVASLSNGCLADIRTFRIAVTL
jgi:hypothetical protein